MHNLQTGFSQFLHVNFSHDFKKIFWRSFEFNSWVELSDDLLKELIASLIAQNVWSVKKYSHIVFVFVLQLFDFGRRTLLFCDCFSD